MIKVSLSGNTLYLQLLSLKGYDAIRPEFNFFDFDDTLRRIAQLVLAFTISVKPIFHQALFGHVGAGNAIYFPLGTLQISVSQIKISFIIKNPKCCSF